MGIISNILNEINSEMKENSIQQVSDEEARRLAQRDIDEMERELQDPEAEVSFTKEELDGVMKDIFGEKDENKKVEPIDPYDDDDCDDDDDDDSISGLVGGAIGMVVGGIAGLIGGIALGSIIDKDSDDDDFDDDSDNDDDEDIEDNDIDNDNNEGLSR
jgi:hypothetical protein